MERLTEADKEMSKFDVLLDPELRRLATEVSDLGQLIGDAIGESVNTLERRTRPAGESLITLDHQVRKKRFRVETDCLSLIVAQQPKDGDLHNVAAMLEIVTELEHIGGYVTDMVRIRFLMPRVDESLVPLVAPVLEMAEITQEMLRRALTAFSTRDFDLALQVRKADDVVDALYNQIYTDVLAFMIGKPRALVKQARYIAEITRNLERAADRVTNMCEWVAFSVTGEVNLVQTKSTTRAEGCAATQT
jgi:phosphate transport system protein